MFGREILGMWGKKKCCGGIKMENIFISQIPITSKKQEQNEGVVVSPWNFMPTANFHVLANIDI